MDLRIGDVLVEQGILSRDDRDAVLEMQRKVKRPFGVLAEEMFGITRHSVELAWAEQYASLADHVDPTSETIDPAAHGVISRRQAWQFGLFPLRFEGDQLVLATTKENLPRALRFTGWRLACPCYLVVADPEPLGRAMMELYPMAGMSSEVFLASV
jgi:MshEN domain